MYLGGQMKYILLLTLLASPSFANDRIKSLIAAESVRQGIDPRIPLAIAKVESNYNPLAVGPVGELGVFQIRPRVEADFTRLLDPKYNIREGIRQLKWWAANCPIPDKSLFFICFNNGFRKPKYPTLLPYYRRVAAVLENYE